MADGAFKQAEGEHVIGPGCKAALRYASHLPVLRRARGYKIAALRDSGPAIFMPREIRQRVGDKPGAVDRERLQGLDVPLREHARVAPLAGVRVERAAARLGGRDDESRGGAPWRSVR